MWKNLNALGLYNGERKIKMTKELARGLLTAIKENLLYDFIANNYTRLSQYELARIAMELDFVCNKKPTDEIKEELIDGIINYLGEDD